MARDEAEPKDKEEQQPEDAAAAAAKSKKNKAGSRRSRGGASVRGPVWAAVHTRCLLQSVFSSGAG